ncbi:hypothetical protein DFJ74DRAFT_701585 [Hyaloraphidium curvatum]|nr:hypothetical protein DFJ74DRAFT_701585 [Hyaloraphidium curvatum]
MSAILRDGVAGPPTKLTGTGPVDIDASRPAEFYPIHSLEDYFSGTWRFDRTIVDRFRRPAGSPERSTVRGTASFIPSESFADSKSGELVGAGPGEIVRQYVEQGAMELPGSRGPLEVRQTYRFFFRRSNQGEPDSAAVYFSYLSPFHTLGPPASPNVVSDGREDIRHPCVDDMYDGRYEVWSSDTYFVEWTVLGPEKDYTSRTVFRRAG